MSFSCITGKISVLIYTWVPILEKLPDHVLMNERNWQNRSIKQVLGHMIDSASNNHQRMVRLQYTKKLVFPDYRRDNDLWIAIQDFQHEDWNNLVQLWKFYNLHIIHLIHSFDTACLDNYWNDFEGTKVTLEQMVEGYLWHMELHLKEIQVVLNQNNSSVI
jgi:hypothetical protein